jgi:GNAT superfamily N-acetyltransferase
LSAYRFCRTDDIGLLVDALNQCWAPHFPDDPPGDAATFKRSIRDLQVWCSSCMVAFAGSDPIGILIGAKRPSATLVYKIAVHPDHVRQGHARHLLTSLSSKLAILGPPRIVAEVAHANAAARSLFAASGYAEETVLTDYVLEGDAGPVDHVGLVIPITIEDLAANGLLEGAPRTCWERSAETLSARKNEIEGLAVASEERIEAYILYIKDAPEIQSLRSFVEDGGARLKQLLFRFRTRGAKNAVFRKVHTAEIPSACLEALGFRPSARHVLYSARARAS